MSLNLTPAVSGVRRSPVNAKAPAAVSATAESLLWLQSGPRTLRVGRNHPLKRLGRVQLQVRRGFIANDGESFVGDLLKRVYPRATNYESCQIRQTLIAARSGVAWPDSRSPRQTKSMGGARRAWRLIRPTTAN